MGGKARKVKLTFLRLGRASFVNELVCTAGAAQWPRARSWHATDSRLKLTLTAQIITFSLWKLALPSHSSHSVSASPSLASLLSAPHISSVIFGGRMVLTLKSNYLSFTCLPLPLIMNFKQKKKKSEIIIFLLNKSKLWAEKRHCHNMCRAIWC